MRALLSRTRLSVYTHFRVSVKAGLRESLIPNECLHKDPRRKACRDQRAEWFLL